MKINQMNVGGVDYPICLSTRAMIEICDKHGGLEAVYDKLKSKKTAEVLKTVIWMMHLMMDAGARYITAQGGAPSEVPSEDDILDLIGIDDLAGITSRTITAIQDNVTPNVAVEPDNASKNVETTPAK